MRTVQQSLFIDDKKRVAHGGSLARGRRKSRRPLDPKRGLHLVFRSESAVGRLSLHRFRAPIQAILKNEAARCSVRVYRFSNNANHLHLLIKGRDRRGIQAFLRAFAGRVAMVVTGARKGNEKGKFWSGLVFTRIVEWGKAFTIAKGYIVQNELETRGLIRYRKRAVKRTAERGPS